MRVRVRARQHGHDLGDRERRLDPAVLQAVLEQHVRDGLHLGRGSGRGRGRGSGRGTGTGSGRGTGTGRGTGAGRDRVAPCAGARRYREI